TFAKIDVPMTSALGGYAGGRFDATRGYGSHFSPAFGLSYNALPTVTLRASRFEGFRAPALSELHRVSGSLSAAVPQLYFVPRDLGPCAITIIDTPDQLGCSLYTASIDNALLQPEVSRTNALGIAWFPAPSFSLDFDLYDTVRRHEIADLPLEY